MRHLLAVTPPLALALVTACAAKVDTGAPSTATPAASAQPAGTARSPSSLVTCGERDFELCVRPVEEHAKLSEPARFREGGSVLIELTHPHGNNCVSGSVHPDDASALRIADAGAGSITLEGRYCLAPPPDEQTDDCATAAPPVRTTYRDGLVTGRNVVRLGGQELAFEVPGVPPPEGLCVTFRQAE